MTGKEIAWWVRKPGTVYVGMLTEHDVVPMQVVKAALLEWLSRYGDEDCGMYCEQHGGELYLYNS